ncbi:MAG: FtsW/RodA/SpoVE family cell cycle protein, partial [Bacteroidales bacterium]|nr:FtsW/RodA/SpoVE family cell cycle protein [Bacteroidales bacterium]
DLGTALVLLITGYGILFVGGINWKIWITIVVVLGLSAPLLYGQLKPYQKKRISDFVGKPSYHVKQALIAIGSGGLEGKSKENSTQTQLKFLPVSSTDFIFAYLGERLGFKGMMTVIVLYILLIFNLLYISAKTNTPDSVVFNIPAPEHYKMIYRSKVIGLDNCWDLWLNHEHKVAVVSIRATTRNVESSLENLYAAMVSAKGELILSKQDTFRYCLAPDKKAAVHVGWLLSTAFLSKDIIPKIDSLYQEGVKDFILMGHSQGGAINYLLTAYLYNLIEQNKLPGDIRFKTYCSAAPKPGNLFFAYYYESITKNWAFNVVNSADWVPETPISIQTLDDFNETNLFKNAKKEIRKLKFPKNMVLKHIYNQLDKPTKKAQRKYEKYLGEMTSKLIRKKLSGFSPPEYFNSNNYVRTGQTVVLFANDKYFEKFPESSNDIGIHHNFNAYLFLLSMFKN